MVLIELVAAEALVQFHGPLMAKERQHVSPT